MIVDREAELKQAHEAEQQAPLISDPRALLVALEQVLVERRLQLAGTIEEQLTSQRSALEFDEPHSCDRGRSATSSNAQLRLLRARRFRRFRRAHKISRSTLNTARSMRAALVDQDRSVALRRLIDERIEANTRRQSRRAASTTAAWRRLPNAPRRFSNQF
jgi:hypothetical protein